MPRILVTDEERARIIKLYGNRDFHVEFRAKYVKAESVNSGDFPVNLVSDLESCRDQLSRGDNTQCFSVLRANYRRNWKPRADEEKMDDEEKTAEEEKTADEESFNIDEFLNNFFPIKDNNFNELLNAPVADSTSEQLLQIKEHLTAMMASSGAQASASSAPASADSENKDVSDVFYLLDQLQSDQWHPSYCIDYVYYLLKIIKACDFPPSPVTLHRIGVERESVALPDHDLASASVECQFAAKDSAANADDGTASCLLAKAPDAPPCTSIRGEGGLSAQFYSLLTDDAKDHLSKWFASQEINSWGYPSRLSKLFYSLSRTNYKPDEYYWQKNSEPLTEVLFRAPYHAAVYTFFSVTAGQREALAAQHAFTNLLLMRFLIPGCEDGGKSLKLWRLEASEYLAQLAPETSPSPASSASSLPDASSVAAPPSASSASSPPAASSASSPPAASSVAAPPSASSASSSPAASSVAAPPSASSASSSPAASSRYHARGAAESFSLLETAYVSPEKKGVYTYDVTETCLPVHRVFASYIQGSPDAAEESIFRQNEGEAEFLAMAHKINYVNLGALAKLKPSAKPTI